MKLTDVAAAVIERRAADGATEFLLGQRAPGSFYPGFWEFPGGKVEAGETPHGALVRELHEELGIEVLRADPWLRREHVYEHAHVRLNFFRVREWRGELRDHVHSALSWQRTDAPTVAPMLPANAPVLAALALPDFYAITHAAEIGIDAQLLALAHALEAGLKLVQLREPTLDAARRSAFVHAAVDLCHQFGARVLVNGDAALAAESGADGLHLPARQLAACSSAAGFPAGRGLLPFGGGARARGGTGLRLHGVRPGARHRQPSGRGGHRLGGVCVSARRPASADFCAGRLVGRRSRCCTTPWCPRHCGDTRRLVSLVQSQVETGGPDSNRHPGLDPGSRNGRLDSGVRRNDEFDLFSRSQLLLRLIFRPRFLRRFDAILFRRPGAEVDALAARRTKRPVTVFGQPCDQRAAAGTGYGAGFFRF